MSKIIAITMGDPAGISPEIIIKSLSEGELNGIPAVVIGCASTLRRIMAMNITPQAELRVLDRVQDARFAPGIINVIDEPLADPNALKPGVVQKEGGGSGVALRKASYRTGAGGRGTCYCHRAAEQRGDACGGPSLSGSYRTTGAPYQYQRLRHGALHR
ncbi:4-hydroxy-L-threonine phosphate dehydrogenase PdxA [Pantoea eucalypti]